MEQADGGTTEKQPPKDTPMTATLTTYRRHNCTRRHRTFGALARCIWPRAAWISGEGAFVVVAHCRVTTVTLHADVEAAQSALDTIDGGSCGGRCSRHHKLVRLEPQP